jgi:acid phosphatase class B
MKISFDYDGVLSTKAGKTLASIKMKQGHLVYIVTARQDSDSETVYNTAKELGLPRMRVHFTNGKDKWPTIKQLGIQMHYDNNQEQITKINENTTAEGRLYTPAT